MQSEARERRRAAAHAQVADFGRNRSRELVVGQAPAPRRSERVDGARGRGAAHEAGARSAVSARARRCGRGRASGAAPLRTHS
jgi:hypothetical protein